MSITAEPLEITMAEIVLQDKEEAFLSIAVIEKIPV